MREGTETEQRPAVQICDTGRTAAFWKKFKLDAEVMEGQRLPYRSTFQIGVSVKHCFFSDLFRVSDAQRSLSSHVVVIDVFIGICTKPSSFIVESLRLLNSFLQACTLLHRVPYRWRPSLTTAHPAVKHSQLGPAWRLRPSRGPATIPARSLGWGCSRFAGRLFPKFAAIFVWTRGMTGLNRMCQPPYVDFRLYLCDKLYFDIESY